MAKSVVAQQKDWQKEDDARVLAEAKQIQADPSRLKGAQEAAKRMAEDATKRAKALGQVAGRSSSKQAKKK
jgi:hypothetical protein